MRKLKLQIQLSIDGFVAGPTGETDWQWLSNEMDTTLLDKIVELAYSCDTLLLGRKMTRVFVDHWENMVDNQPDNPFNTLAQQMVNMRKITFSKTETSISGRNLEVENGDLASTIKALKEQTGQDIMVYGGADFVTSLIKEDLVDEYYLIINPVAIGAGLSIFTDRKILKLESATAYKSGKIINKYLRA